MILSINDMSFSYANDSKIIIEKCSLELKKNNIYSLLGENGEGKTTFLNLLTQNILPTSGYIKIYTKKMSYMTDTAFFYPNMNLLEMGEIIRILKKLDRDEYLKEFNFYLSKLDLDEYKFYKIKDLSLGTKKRIQLLYSLMGDPDFIIMDEPTNGLDPLQIYNVKDIIKKLNKIGKTILISTHSIQIAEELSNEVLILKKGNIKLIENNHELESEFISN